MGLGAPTPSWAVGATRRYGDGIAETAVTALPAPSPPAARRRSGRRRALGALRRVAVGTVATLVLGNLGMLAASLVARGLVNTAPVPVAVDGVEKLAVVSPRVWRGAAPAFEGYRALAAAGVTTVVDLRAEEDAAELDPIARAAGLEVVHLPIRDGQLPTPEQVAAFDRVVAGSPGTVFLHCGAGVGRTGAMAAAYLVGTGQADGESALARNLAIGPPSLEQVVFAATVEPADVDRPPLPVVALSRFLDAPRRIWHSL